MLEYVGVSREREWEKGGAMGNVGARPSVLGRNICGGKGCDEIWL